MNNDENKQPIVSQDQLANAAAETSAGLVRSIPKEVRSVFALRAFGFSIRDIAETLGMSRSAVSRAIAKYDPLRLSDQADTLRRFALSLVFERIAFEALSSITRADILSIPPSERISLAKAAVSAAVALAPNQPSVPSDDRAFLTRLKIASTINRPGVDARDLFTPAGDDGQSADSGAYSGNDVEDGLDEHDNTAGE